MNTNSNWLSRLFKNKNVSGEEADGVSTPTSSPAETEFTSPVEATPPPVADIAWIDDARNAVAGEPSSRHVPDETLFVEASGAGDLSDSDSLSPASSEWNIGDVILDLYEVKELLGEGGFGKVYRVHHKGWNVDLAVKTPKLEQQAELHRARVKENFVSEAETWVNLGLHPHIVSCFYVRELYGIPRVFAEYVEGGSLSEWIKSRKLYEGGPEEALKRMLDIAIQFAWGLHFAHEQGLVHQDVKPANVMMSAGGTAKVTDFGFARARALIGATEEVSRDKYSDVAPGAGAMTLTYCSPEQARGEPLTPATDIWSWGLSVLEMFAGEVTWANGQTAAFALADYQENNEPSSEIPRMPAAVAELLKRCFASEPSARPSNTLEIADPLQQIYREIAGTTYSRKLPKEAKALADSLNNRAVSMIDLGKKDEALRLWEEALRVQDRHLEATYNHGLTLWRDGKMGDLQLIRELESVETADKKSLHSTYLKALVHLERNNPEAAVELLNTPAPAEEATTEIKQLQLQANERLSAFQSSLIELDEDHDEFLKFSPNGKMMTTFGGLSSRKVKLWDVRTRMCARTLEGHTSGVHLVKFSPSGRLIASGASDSSGGDNGVVKLWDLHTGACLRTFNLKKSPQSIEFSRDEKFIVVSEGYNFSPPQLFEGFNLHTGERLYSIEHGEFSTLQSCGDQSFILFIGAAKQESKTLKLLNARTGVCLQTFKGHRGIISGVSLSRNGLLAATASSDRTIKLWDVKTGTCLKTFAGLTNPHSGTQSAVSFSRDGRFILVEGWMSESWPPRSTRLINVKTGECTFASDGEATTSMAKAHATFARTNFSPDGRCVAFADKDNTIKLLDVETGECLRTFKGHQYAVDKLIEFSPDGNYLVSICAVTLKLWEVKTGRCLHTTERKSVNAAAFNCDSQVLAIAYREKIIQVWFLNENRFQSPLLLNKVYSSEKTLESLDLFDRYLTQGRDFLNKKDYLASVRCAKNARSIPGFEYDKQAIELWSKLYQKLPQRSLKAVLMENERHPSPNWIKAETFNGPIFAQATVLSPDGELVASGFKATVKLWETQTGETVHELGGYTSHIEFISFSPDGRVFAAGGGYDSIKVWEVRTGDCLHTFEGHESRIEALGFSPTGSFIASGGWDKIIKLWDVRTRSCLRVLEGHRGSVAVISFSPDGQLIASGSWDKTIKLWQLETGNCLRTFEGHENYVETISFSPDGQFIVSGGRDKFFKLWKVQTGECLHTFAGHSEKILSLSFSPNGDFIASSSRDLTLKLWSVKTGECLWSLDTSFRERGLSNERTEQVVFNPDGKTLLFGRGSRGWAATILYFLDWELEEHELAEWDASAAPYLRNFLTLHTPPAGALSLKRKPTEDEIASALMRKGRPAWNEDDFEQLMYQLGCAGFGYMTPERVRRELEKMAAE